MGPTGLPAPGGLKRLMARPIRSRPTPSSPGGPAALAETLGPELDASAASIRDLLELVRLLEERGVLRFSADVLRSEDRLVAVLTDRLDPVSIRRAVQNLEVLVRTFERLDPTTLAALTGGLPAALEEAHRAEGAPPMGLLEIATAVRDPEVNRGVRMVLGLLRGIGRRAGP